MFSLIKYHNDKFSIVKSTAVERIGRKSCIVKCNGGKYEAFFVYENDNKCKLLALKKKYEEKLSPKAKVLSSSPIFRNFTRQNPNNLASKNSYNLRGCNTARTKKFKRNETNLASELQICTNSLKKTKYEKRPDLISVNKECLSNSCKINSLGSVAAKPVPETAVGLRDISQNTRNELIVIPSYEKELNSNGVNSYSIIFPPNFIRTENKTINLVSNLPDPKTSVEPRGNGQFPLNENKVFSIILPPTKLSIKPYISSLNNEKEQHLSTSFTSVNSNQSVDQVSSSSQGGSMNPLPLVEYSLRDLSDISQKSEKSLCSSLSGKKLADSFDQLKFFNSNSFDISPISFTATQNEDNDQSRLTNSIIEYCLETVTDASQKMLIESKNTNISPMKVTDNGQHTEEDFPNMSVGLNSAIQFSVQNTIDISYGNSDLHEVSNSESAGLFDSNISVILPPKLSSSDLSHGMQNEPQNQPLELAPLSIEEIIDISESILENEVIVNINQGNISTDRRPNFFASSSIAISSTISSATNSNSINNQTVSNAYNSQCNSEITTLPDISSELGNNSSFSEYNPNISINIREESIGKYKENSMEKDDIVNEIDMPLDIKKVLVPYSKTTKKHFCIFCKKLQCKISRHLFLKHGNEEEIKKAFVLPKRSAERLKILNDIRKKGDFEHNTSSKYNSGILIVSRQQLSKCKNEVDDYVCCKSCKGFFSKKTFRLHRSSCAIIKGGNGRTESSRITQFIHPVASKALKLTIFPVLRTDEVVKSIRYDELIIKYGNKLTEKYTSQHQHDMIRSYLRLLGRFMIEIKTLDPSVRELKDIYKPQLFDNCQIAVRNVADWNKSLMFFGKPSVATNLTTLIKRCGNKQRTEYIKDQCEDAKVELENFLLLWEEEIPLINKKALEDQANQKRNKKVVLPLKSDIKQLHAYLKGKIVICIKMISENFSVQIWCQLVEVTLTFTQIFNRRRSGEIERLTIENFDNKEIITDIIEGDVLKNVSKETIEFAKQFVRISLRGKLGRTVSVLLCPMIIKAIELIMLHRKDAGVSHENKYVFGKPTTSSLSKPYFRACPLLKRFAKECGAKFPKSLRGTTLRKHIATYTSLLNLEEASVERLANFMGHHKDIHKSIYRMPIPVAEIACVSKLLMAAVGEDEDVDDEEDEEVEIDDLGDKDNYNEVNSFDNDSESGSWLEDRVSVCERKRNTSLAGTKKRIRWSNSEKEEISSIFGDIYNLKKLPSLTQCRNAIGKSVFLSRRTPQQLKSWIDNQRRCKNV